MAGPGVLFVVPQQVDQLWIGHLNAKAGFF